MNIPTQKQLDEIRLQELREKLTPYRQIRSCLLSPSNHIKIPQIKLYDDYLSFKFDKPHQEHGKQEICLN